MGTGKANVRNLTDETKRSGIECDLQAVETATVAAASSVHKVCLESLNALEEAYPNSIENPMIRHWSTEETEERILMPNMGGSFTFPAFSVHPYKLTCGFLKLSLDDGLNLQTHTPVTDVQHMNQNWPVHTHRGTIMADNVILATNAYTVALYAPLGDVITPIRAQIVAMRPGSNITGNKVLKKTISPATSTCEDYCITRAEGLIGAGDFIIGEIAKFYTQSTH